MQHKQIRLASDSQSGGWSVSQIGSGSVTFDEALAVVDKFLADRDRPKLRWDADDPPLIGTPVLYVPCEDEFEEPVGRIGGLVILLEVEGEDPLEGFDYVMVHIGRETATMKAERVGDSIQVTVIEEM